MHLPDFLSAFATIPFDWASAFRILIWTVVASLVIAGFAGTFLPILPGTTLILAGCAIHYFALGLESSGLSWIGLAIITVLYVISVIVDYLSGAIGAKWFGSTKWGIWGAIIGGIIGLFFSLPGIIIGPILGVFLFETLFAGKKLAEAGNSTVGTVVGGIAGMFLRVGLAMLMVGCYVWDAFFFN